MSSTTDNVVIADMSRILLGTINEISTDPYTQIAILKSAASVIEHKLQSHALKAAIATALTNIVNPQR